MRRGGAGGGNLWFSNTSNWSRSVGTRRNSGAGREQRPTKRRLPTSRALRENGLKEAKAEEARGTEYLDVDKCISRPISLRLRGLRRVREERIS